jgi:hypothetical protein
MTPLRLLPVLVVLLALLVAGCGGGGSGHRGSGTAGGATTITARTNGVASKRPEQIVAAAVKAIDEVSSVHVAGSLVDNGIPVSLDLRLARSGGGEGTVSENGLSFRLIAVNHNLYILGSPAFWNHFGGSAAAKLFHNKWLKVPNSGQFATLGALTSIRALFGQLLTSHGKLAGPGRATMDGQPAVTVRDTTAGGTLYVATTGQPYPLQILKAGHNGGHVRFSDFNRPVSLQPPPHAIRLPGTG